MQKLGKISRIHFSLLMSKSPIVKALNNLEVNEALIFTKKEWKIKSPPYQYVGGYFKGSGKKFTVRVLPDKSGFAFRRTK